MNLFNKTKDNNKENNNMDKNIDEIKIDEMKIEDSESVLLDVSGLSVSFNQYVKNLKQVELNVIHDLNLKVKKGEIVAVVGSSGSGKSLLAHAILGILPSNAVVSGNILYNGELLNDKRKKQLRGREITFIPQSVNYLDPLMKVCKQVQIGMDKKDASKNQKKLFSRYGLKTKDEVKYPFELSGGMLRRVLISTSIRPEANLIIADEPTPGLHPEALEETKNQIKELANQGKGVIMITHDIHSALDIADKIAVFYAGSTLEVALVSDFEGEGENLRHPYTKALWKSLPQNGFKVTEGSQPMANKLPSGCLYSPRCENTCSICKDERPKMREIRNGMVRCNNAT